MITSQAVILTLMLLSSDVGLSLESSKNATSKHQLNFTNKGLREVPRGISRSTQLLLLNNNHIKELENPFKRLDHLLELDLSNNSLALISRGDIFANLPHLKRLDLSYNRIKFLYAGVFRGLKRLEILNLSNGQLRYLDEHTFQDLDNLKVLNLADNQLKTIFLELFQNTPNLEQLNLNGNGLTHLIGGFFASLTGLIRLFVANNHLITINDNAFVGLDALEEIYLQDNYLDKVPSIALQSLKRIRLVNIGGNPFTSLLTGDFVHTSVREIWLDRCDKLQSVERMAFWDLPALSDLHLENGASLRYLDNQAFRSVPSLSVLYLHNNSLLTIQEEMVNNITLRQRHYTLNISLHLNPFHCDCNIHFLYQSLNSGNHNSIQLIDGDQLMCTNPSNSSSKNLIRNLPPESIQSECAPTLLDVSSPTEVNLTVTRKIGDRVSLDCQAIGHPPPSIFWILPDGQHFNSSSNTIHMQLKTHGSLKVFHLRSKDAGKYTCVAFNRHGNASKSVHLIVESPSIQIWPLGVSSTFVSIVWNGTSRNSFPEYQILYKQEDDPSDRFESITIGHFVRSYTITDLEPHKKYKLCIAVRDEDVHRGYVQLSCTQVETQGSSSLVDSLNHTSNLAFKLSVFTSILLLVVVSVSIRISRHSRQRHYETPQKSLLNDLASIPMSQLPRVNQ